MQTGRDVTILHCELFSEIVCDYDRLPSMQHLWPQRASLINNFTEAVPESARHFHPLSWELNCRVPGNECFFLIKIRERVLLSSSGL